MFNNIYRFDKLISIILTNFKNIDSKQSANYLLIQNVLINNDV